MERQKDKGIIEEEEEEEEEEEGEYVLSTHKIVTTVTDNGSNFVKAFRLFQVNSKLILTNSNSNLQNDIADNDLQHFDINEVTQYSSESEYEPKHHGETQRFKSDRTSSSDLPSFLARHLRCASDTLSLCVKDAINSIETSNELSSIHNNVLKKCNLWKCAAKPKTSEIISNLLGHTLSRPIETR
ncbi:hypothetical protein KPH14_012599 [Odynerus spinipes]|uniref:Uncharacterized protein n=1 Tax=Odynerus spinipes TaxID=1348599 RepID=A0AAD9VLJ1_9HYME|nr:hypothetical protein KPH14_012599 [Odynerus spinipes]